MSKLFSGKKKFFIIGGIILLVIVLLVKANNARKEEIRKAEEADKRTEEMMEEMNKSSSDASDSVLMEMQPDLIASYGKVPEGFIWEADGTVLSLGDKDMSAEEVVYAYFRGLSTLDMSTVERYSRDSSVVQTYSGYFDEKNKNTDYMDQFLRNMYKECLLSLEINGIENQSVFAENKIVFTVSAKMLDLTNKSFWEKDKMKIFENLYLYDSNESDSAKSDMYLYDYILEYYRSEDANKRDVTFDITVQRYPDLDSGWLVSIDTDVDDACKYKDGKLVVSYIRETFRDKGREELGLE